MCPLRGQSLESHLAAQRSVMPTENSPMPECGATILGDMSRFVKAERARFGERENLFAGHMSALHRYRQFLGIIAQRYVAASEALAQHFELARVDIKRADGAWFVRSGELGDNLHLEIESFYLFAKILLDKIAHCVEFYFGPERGLSIDSHDNFAKSAVEYVERKGLSTTAFVDAAPSWKLRISDYRDYNIAHEKSPRAQRASLVDAEGNGRMAAFRLFPKNGESQKDTEVVTVLLVDLDSYLQLLLRFMAANQNKAHCP